MKETTKKKGYKKYILLGFFTIAVIISGIWIAAGNKISSHEQKALYQCPMHPAIISDKPSDCPICGMKLVPIKETTVQNDNDIEVTGLSTVKISTEQEQLIGVRTGQVEKKEFVRTILAPGKVAHDIELYNALKEYQIAASSGFAEDSKFKLYHMGLSDEEIDTLAKRKDLTSFLFVNKPGSSVWVYAQIYEMESALVKKGQVMEISSLALPGRTFTAKIQSISSFLDEQSRTLKVRGEVLNPEDTLKPEMLLDVKIKVALGKKLTIPGEAVIDTGKRKITFIKTGSGTYEPRELVTGFPGDGYFEVLSGVKEGDQVVTSGSFLIDSESKIKSVIKNSNKKP